MHDIFCIEDVRGDVKVIEAGDKLGDRVIRVYQSAEDVILEVSEEENPFLFSAIYHLMRLHREREREYFKLVDNVTPQDRDRMMWEDIGALSDTMEDIMKSIEILAFGR